MFPLNLILTHPLFFIPEDKVKVMIERGLLPIKYGWVGSTEFYSNGWNKICYGRFSDLSKVPYKMFRFYLVGSLLLFIGNKFSKRIYYVYEWEETLISVSLFLFITSLRFLTFTSSFSNSHSSTPVFAASPSTNKWSLWDWIAMVLASITSRYISELKLLMSNVHVPLWEP